MAQEKQCGYDEAIEAQDVAHDEISHLNDVLSATPARSVRGLVAKARAAETTKDSDLAWSVIDDLVAMEA
jgi:hypothetical protein